jgi:hypothetical protein
MAVSSTTGKLRYILKDGQRILQQEWRMPYTYLDTHGEWQLDYDYEWRDVPLYTPPKEGKRC